MGRRQIVSAFDRVAIWHAATRRLVAMPYHPDVERLEFEHPDKYPGMPWMAGHKADYTKAKLDGKMVAELRWWPDNEWTHDHPLKPKPYEVQGIDVHPAHRRKNFGTALFNWTKQNAVPDLHHSDKLTDMGAAFAKSMGHEPPEGTPRDPPLDQSHWKRR